jgi:hypothetical protein
MSLDLYIGPRRNRRGRVIAWLGLTLLIAGVVAWQWGWQPGRMATALVFDSGCG